MWQLLARLARQLPAEAAHQLAVETLRWKLGPRRKIDFGPIDLSCSAKIPINRVELGLTKRGLL